MNSRAQKLVAMARDEHLCNKNDDKEESEEEEESSNRGDVTTLAQLKQDVHLKRHNTASCSLTYKDFERDLSYNDLNISNIEESIDTSFQLIHLDDLDIVPNSLSSMFNDYDDKGNEIIAEIEVVNRENEHQLERNNIGRPKRGRKRKVEDQSRKERKRRANVNEKYISAKGKEVRVRTEIAQEDAQIVNLEKAGKGRKPVLKNINLPECWPNGKSLSVEKLKDLKELMKLIPADAKPFYDFLKHTPGVSIDEDIDGYHVEDIEQLSEDGED